MADVYDEPGTLCVRETEKAILVQRPGSHEMEWVPKSAIHDDSEVYQVDPDPGKLVVYGWFARSRDWFRDDVR